MYFLIARHRQICAHKNYTAVY